MESVPPLAREAIEHARRRDFDKALATARKALEQHSDDMGLQLFVGLLHSRRMEFEEALPHLRIAVELAPRDAAARLELARALMAVGDLDDSEALLAGGGLPARESELLRASIRSRKGDVTAAVEGFRKLVEADPSDFESWGNLGVTLLNSGDAAAAAEALGRSLELRPDRPRVLDKWAEAHVAARTGEEALERIRSQLKDRPNDVLLRLLAARLQDLLGRSDQAVDELEQALHAEPNNGAALAALADLYERQNQLENFAATVERLEKAAPHSESLPLLQATLALRRGSPDEALAFARSASPVTDPGSRAFLIGKICDRLGRTEEAWEAYSVMNHEDERAVLGALSEAQNYLRELDRQLGELTPEWAVNWTGPANLPSTPAFIVGFPRSGTTLLDTFLMGHSDLCVSEENPLLQTVSDAAKDLKLLPAMSPHDVTSLRELYFAEAAKYVPDSVGRRLVDKLPFALVAGPHIHRLFPAAPILFVERHPCDVVLSCYFNRFQPTGPGASFVDLVQTARLYDGMMRFWMRSREVLPLRVHSVRYERMVADPEAELRGVAQFLNLDWTDELVDNRQTAAKRGFIRTPSYAQVTQPVYTHSVERWTRYRTHFEPVLAILEPWAKSLGYEI